MYHHKTNCTYQRYFQGSRYRVRIGSHTHNETNEGSSMVQERYELKDSLVMWVLEEKVKFGA